MLSWQDALRRIYEIFHGVENAKATVIRPQELPFRRRQYVCMYVYRAVYITGDQDYTKLRLPLRRPHKNTNGFSNDRSE